MLTFFLQRQFSKGLGQGREVEQRIIAKTARSTGLGDHFASHLTPEGLDGLSIACDGNYTDVFPGVAIMQLGKSLQLLDQSSIVGSVVRILVGRDMVAVRNLSGI